MRITAVDFTRFVAATTSLMTVPAYSMPIRVRREGQESIEARQSVSGAFGLPINHIILGFLFASTMFSLAGRLQGIASDWFDNDGPTGITVIKEIQEPKDEYEYDEYADSTDDEYADSTGDEYAQDIDEMDDVGRNGSSPSVHGRVVSPKESGSEGSRANISESPQDSVKNGSKPGQGVNRRNGS